MSGPERQELPGPQTPPRFFELLRVLCEHGVEFVVIGGLAVGFHGVPRATKDVDVVPAPGTENLGRLWRALEALDARQAELADFRQEEMPLELSLAALVEGGGNWVLYTRFGRLDVMQWVEAVVDYDALRRDAVRVDEEQVGFPLWVAGLADVLAMKQAAGRDQDRIDLSALRMAHGLEE